MSNKFDLTKFDVCDVILFAIKSELDSKAVYEKLASRTRNAFLKDRMTFLVKEEENHKLLLERVFKKLFPEKQIEIPEENIVPLPNVIVSDDKPISDVLEEAMLAEQSVQEYYEAMSELFHDDKNIQKTLLFLSKMELGHYQILKLERDNAKFFDNFEEGWELMHVGP